MSNTPASRRRLIGSGAALLLLAPFAAGTTKAAELDGELLTLCDLFHGQHAAADVTPNDDDDALHAAMDERWDTSDAIPEIRPRTPEGVQAKAGVALVLLFENAQWDNSGDTRFAVSLLRDLVGGAKA